jgi:hypothetical protein
MAFSNENYQSLEQGVVNFGNSIGKVIVGNTPRKELLKMMGEKGIIFNDKGVKKFVLSDKGKEEGQEIILIKFKVGDLAHGRNSVLLGEIVKTAMTNGLRLCPREAALQFALKEGDQLKGPIGILVENGGDFGYINVDVDFEREEIDSLERKRKITISLLNEFGRDGIDDMGEEVVMME